MSDSSDQMNPIDALLSRSRRLHTAPTVALRVVEITGSPAFRTEDVVECLRNDPALTGAILRLVNSSRFGLRYRITSLRQAVSYLGSRVLRLMALGFGLVQHLTENRPGELYQLYWKRSLTMAGAARICAERIGEDADEAFTAGLLSDIGMLVLAQSSGHDYANMALTAANSESLIEAEQQQFGFDHAEVTARLLRTWNLPSSFVEAAELHHRSDGCYEPLTQIVRASSLLADALWWPQSTRMESLTNLLAEEFDCDVDDLIDLALACQGAVQEAAEVFGVRLPAEIDIALVESEARSQLQMITLDAMFELDGVDSAADLPHGPPPSEF